MRKTTKCPCKHLKWSGNLSRC